MIDLGEIAATLETLRALLAAVLDPIGHQALGTCPELGEWSVLEMIGHLAIGENGGR